MVNVLICFYETKTEPSAFDEEFKDELIEEKKKLQQPRFTEKFNQNQNNEKELENNNKLLNLKLKEEEYNNELTQTGSEFYNAEEENDSEIRISDFLVIFIPSAIAVCFLTWLVARKIFNKSSGKNKEKQLENTTNDPKTKQENEFVEIFSKEEFDKNKLFIEKIEQALTENKEISEEDYKTIKIKINEIFLKITLAKVITHYFGCTETNPYYENKLATGGTATIRVTIGKCYSIYGENNKEASRVTRELFQQANMFLYHFLEIKIGNMGNFQLLKEIKISKKLVSAIRLLASQTTENQEDFFKILRTEMGKKTEEFLEDIKKRDLYPISLIEQQVNSFLNFFKKQLVILDNKFPVEKNIKEAPCKTKTFDRKYFVSDFANLDKEYLKNLEEFFNPPDQQ